MVKVKEHCHSCCTNNISKYFFPVFLTQMFSGNSDRNTVVTNIFATPAMAQYIRILSVEWTLHIGMRVELLGCQGGESGIMNINWGKGWRAMGGGVVCASFKKVWNSTSYLTILAWKSRVRKQKVCILVPAWIF